MEKVDNAKKEIELEKGRETANADLPDDATASAADASSSSDAI